MIIPLFLEQLLVMCVGMADTIVVSHVGEAAVSGVSLVNQFNTIFIYLFTALSSGGASIISQYIGRKDREQGGKSASQLLLFSTIFSIDCRTGASGKQKSDESAVWKNRRLCNASVPYVSHHIGILLSGTCCLQFRSYLSQYGTDKSNHVYLYMVQCDQCNWKYCRSICSACRSSRCSIPIFDCPCFSAVVITILCFQKKNEVSYDAKWLIRWDGTLLKKILGVAFQMG